MKNLSEKIWNRAKRSLEKAKKNNRYHIESDNDAICLLTEDFIRSNETIEELKKNKNIIFEADRKSNKSNYFIIIFKN